MAVEAPCANEFAPTRGASIVRRIQSVVAVDEAVRTVSYAVKTPVQKLAGLSAGVSHGWASLRTRRSWREAVDEGKAAAERKERDLDEELKATHDG